MQNAVDNDVRAKIYLFGLIEQINGKYMKLFVNRGNTEANLTRKNWVTPKRERGERQN